MNGGGGGNSGAGYGKTTYTKNLSGQQKKKVLVFENWGVVPFKGTVKSIIKGAFKDLRDVLIVNFEKKNGDYSCAFQKSNEWKEGLTKFGYYYISPDLGITPAIINIDVHKKINECYDINDRKTCTNRFLNTAGSLGTALANSAVHEIGHMFNCVGYSGEISAGHTGDASNFMCDYPLIERGSLVKRYEIKDGESFIDVAERLGIPKDRLLQLKGPDGSTNKELLSQGNVIWIRDIEKRTEWFRKVESTKKSFTKEQIEIMRKNIISGEDEIEFH